MWTKAPANKMEGWNKTNKLPEKGRRIAVLDVYNMIDVISSDNFDEVFDDYIDNGSALIGWCYLPAVDNWA